MTEIFLSGRLQQRRDDATRTVTTYDATGAVTNTRPYTAEENAAADAAMADAARLDSIEGRLARIEAHLWPPWTRTPKCPPLSPRWPITRACGPLVAS